MLSARTHGSDHEICGKIEINIYHHLKRNVLFEEREKTDNIVKMYLLMHQPVFIFQLNICML